MDCCQTGHTASGVDCHIEDDWDGQCGKTGTSLQRIGTDTGYRGRDGKHGQSAESAEHAWIQCGDTVYKGHGDIERGVGELPGKIVCVGYVVVGVKSGDSTREGVLSDIRTVFQQVCRGDIDRQLYRRELGVVECVLTHLDRRRLVGNGQLTVDVRCVERIVENLRHRVGNSESGGVHLGRILDYDGTVILVQHTLDYPEGGVVLVHVDTREVLIK